jgi:hypothetical protein
MEEKYYNPSLVELFAAFLAGDTFYDFIGDEYIGWSFAYYEDVEWISNNEEVKKILQDNNSNIDEYVRLNYFIKYMTFCNLVSVVKEGASSPPKLWEHRNYYFPNLNELYLKKTIEL